MTGIGETMTRKWIRPFCGACRVSRSRHLAISPSHAINDRPSRLHVVHVTTSIRQVSAASGSSLSATSEHSKSIVRGTSPMLSLLLSFEESLSNTDPG